MSPIRQPTVRGIHGCDAVRRVHRYGGGEDAISDSGKSQPAAKWGSQGESRGRAFLQYQPCRPFVAGLKHWSSNLHCLLGEAWETGRLAILPPLVLDPKHNFGIDREWKWESYFDLDRSALIDAGGREQPLPISPHRADASLPTLVLQPGEPMPTRARRYPLAIRRIESHTFKREVPTNGWLATNLRLAPAACVLKLVWPVILHLSGLDGGRFVAVHVRRGDRLARREYSRRLTEPPHIRKILQERGVADGAVLFIASDEGRQDFWDPLKKYYRVVRYVDFPSLKAIVAPSNQSPPRHGPRDNYLLYQVEREIMRRAALWIETLPGFESGASGALVGEAEWVMHYRWFEIPWLGGTKRFRLPFSRLLRGNGESCKRRGGP